MPPAVYHSFLEKLISFPCVQLAGDILLFNFLVLCQCEEESMAFYRDFPGEMIEPIELNDKKHSHQLTVDSNRIHENVATNNEELPKPTPSHDNGEDNDKHLS